MKKKILLLFLLFWNLLFSAETISRIIGPGSNYFNYVNRETPVSVHILEIDLSNPNIELITQKAGSKMVGREKTSVMAQQIEAEGKNVIAAINADFFHKDGKPVGIQIADGEIIKNPYIRSVFGLMKNNKPFIEILDFKGWLFAGKRKSEINGINSSRSEDELILYNSYVGVSSNTNNWGYEISAQYLQKPVVNDTSYLVVISKNDVEGNEEIPGYGILLSGHGEKEKFLKNHINIGDTIKILLSLPPTSEKIIEAVSGAPKIIEKGRVKIDVRKEKMPFDFSTTLHPRTSIGFNKEKTKLFMFVVDGRQNEYSIGMSLRELAKFMIDWGVYEGLNLDGGGSSTMYVRGEVMNKPSDKTGERPVSNALIVLCKNQSDKVKYLSLSPKRLRIKPETSFRFDVQMFDQYVNPLKNKTVYYKCDHGFGSFGKDGEFITTNQKGSGYIYIECEGIKDSSWVIVE